MAAPHHSGGQDKHLKLILENLKITIFTLKESQNVSLLYKIESIQ